MRRKEPYACRCFALPVEQVKWFDELTPAQVGQVAYHFGLPYADKFAYAVKRDGALVSSRARLRPEWE